MGASFLKHSWAFGSSVDFFYIYFFFYLADRFSRPRPFDRLAACVQQSGLAELHGSDKG